MTQLWVLCCLNNAHVRLYIIILSYKKTPLLSRYLARLKKLAVNYPCLAITKNYLWWYQLSLKRIFCCAWMGFESSIPVILVFFFRVTDNCAQLRSVSCENTVRDEFVYLHQCANQGNIRVQTHRRTHFLWHLICCDAFCCQAKLHPPLDLLAIHFKPRRSTSQFEAVSECFKTDCLNKNGEYSIRLFAFAHYPLRIFR